MRQRRPSISSEILDQDAIRVDEFSFGQFVEQIKRAFGATLEGCVEGIVDQLADV